MIANFQKENINSQKIPSFLHIPKRICHGYMFRKKNPSIPETVSDWAERSIFNLSEMHKTNISVNETKIRKPNGDSKRAKKGNELLLTKNREPLLVSNNPNIESLKRLDNNKSLPELLEAIDVSPAYSKRPGHKHKITQSSDKEVVIEDIEVVRIPLAKHSCRKTKAAQPPDNEKGVEDV
ncbi:hypothetical protein C1646_747199 [Rhizophagus diaphanus]|nr:hypothetical protein C1646_747199 [Rhizophagus diaphanus] [Rhizophagus sp. MUCL 43196]